MSKYTTVEAYIASFPTETREILQKIRELIHTVVPNIKETIRYDMPTFMLDETYLVYMAAWKKHISVYPFTKEMEKQLPEVSHYTISGKGTIQFPLTQPIPYDVIEKIVSFRLSERTK